MSPATIKTSIRRYAADRGLQIRFRTDGFGNVILERKTCGQWSHVARLAHIENFEDGAITLKSKAVVRI